MAPSIKLTYFDIRGLGESIRLLLNYGGIEFDDNRLSKEGWPTLKSDMPFGQVPLYEEDGKVAWQSVAIARYVAKKVKLNGANDWEDLEIDAIVDTINDLRLKIKACIIEEDEDKKKILKENLFDEVLPYYFEKFDKIAEENGGHLAVKKLTWADVYFFALADNFITITGKEFITKYPNVLQVIHNVAAVPAIKDWVDTRPVTER